MRRLPRSTPATQAGLVAKSISFDSDHSGGTVMPFLMSLMALPDHLQIDGQHQRAAFGRDRALDQRLDEAAVLHHVELEPERLVDRGSDILDRADRHRAQGERNAGGLRGAAGMDFAVAMLHADQPDRRQDQRHRGGLAEDRGGEVALRDVDQDALAELDLLQVGAELARSVSSV